MRRHSGAGGEPVKTRRRKTVTLKRRNVPKVARHRESSAAGLNKKVALFKRERDEAIEQQRVTSEVLRAISNSPTDAASTLGAIAKSVARLLDVTDAEIMSVEGNMLRCVAKHGQSRQWPVGTARLLTRDWVTGRAVIDRTIVQVADLQAQEREFPQGAAYARQYGHRTTLAVPLLREGSAIGAILIRRMDVRPFTDKQTALVQNFAAQAVIAIENTRLLNELRQSLQQQTATADVLKVISRSTFDLQIVLDTLVELAVRLCRADNVVIFLREGENYRLTANYGYSREYEDFMRRHPIAPGRGTIAGRAALECRPVHVLDILADPDYTMVEAQRLGSFRTMLGVPLMRDGIPIGVMTLLRNTVQPFSDTETDLATTFADQAVIAIENGRLVNELRQRTADLSESLEQQTATSEVLRVISSSPGDLQPVFSAMLESAARLCDASFGNIFRWDDDALRLVATYNTPAAFVEARSQFPLRRTQNNPIGEMLAAKTVLHVHDLAADERYINRRDPNIIAAVEQGGVRTFLAVPMLKDNELIGALIVYRQEVRPFSDKQIELVKNFAAQAVIAIENTRLLNELRQRTTDLTQSLEQQTATSQVLSVISSSPANIQPVLEIIGERAEKLCDAEIGVVSLIEGELIRLASIHGMTEAGVEAARRAFPMRRSHETVTARAIRTRSVCHVADVLSDAQYQQKDTARVSGYRGCLGVPMIRDEHVVGAIFVARRQPGLFSDAQV